LRSFASLRIRGGAAIWMTARVSLLRSSGGRIMPTSSGLFSRNFKKTFPIAVKGERCWIIGQERRRYLDAAGQAAVVSIGHGVVEIGRAMNRRGSRSRTRRSFTRPGRKARRAAVRTGGQGDFGEPMSELQEIAHAASPCARLYRNGRTRPEASVYCRPRNHLQNLSQLPICRTF